MFTNLFLHAYDMYFPIQFVDLTSKISRPHKTNFFFQEEDAFRSNTDQQKNCLVTFVKA